MRTRHGISGDFVALLSLNLPLWIGKIRAFCHSGLGISPEGKSPEQIAQAGLDALEHFTQECGIVTSLAELGATKAMLPEIAQSTIFW